MAAAVAVLGAGLVASATAAGLAAQQTPPTDTTLAQEGPYARPFIGTVASTSVGGYLEGNTNWFVEDGVGEGLSMELRRFNVFLFSQITSRIRFLSELEFEHGTEEIALETAQVDVMLRPELQLRAGILLTPIGFLNQNHDSPKWDFVERPLVTTDIVPSTLSEVGVGLFGKVPTAAGILSYDVYLTNGLGDGVVGSESGRTDLAAGKGGEAFGEDNNGSPAVSGRLGLRRPGLGEVGVSYYGGHYNTFRREGIEVDERRWLGLAALDLGATLGRAELRAEVAYATIDVPASLDELFADRQWGGHLDAVVRLRGPLSAVMRVEYVDYNAGTFATTGAAIGDDVFALVPGLSYRPAAGTVFRLNYRYHWSRDFPGNDAARMAGIQLGFATYF